MQREIHSVPSASSVVIEGTEAGESAESSSSATIGTLRLRGGSGTSRRVTWDEEVVDNEEMNKKKSKICCIFHKNREFGESSSDESDSSSESDSDGDKDKHDHQNHNHPDCKHLHRHGSRKKKPGPNAYERQPRYNNKRQS
ncbi:phosphatase inhibitor-domain-containing protein [Lipomyces japonicus]|uniref:phosphatase inhibitor-domain-containing protein n=1 Tax=Lipomyces japonicus TaxID=56871 RepID=UPI0034CDD27A